MAYFSVFKLLFTLRTSASAEASSDPISLDSRLWKRILKLGSALAKRVGQGEVGGCTALANSAWWPLQLPVEKPWSMLGGPFVCFLTIVFPPSYGPSYRKLNF